MATPEVAAPRDDLTGIKDSYEYGFHDSEEDYSFKAKKGLNRQVVEEISAHKDEPQWMRDFRLKALEHFEARPMPKWAGGHMDGIDFQNIHYFVRASEKQGRTWDEVPDDIKNTFDRLGIPEAERKFLAGVGAQYESEVVYHQVREDLEKQGVIFLDMDTGAARARGPGARVLGHRDPAQRQQARRAQLGRLVGRLVRVRPAGSARRDAAAGLLPHQHREHGPVRAHADHRRRGLVRALHRGLHRAARTRPTRCTRRSSRSSAKPGSRVRYTTIQNWSHNVYNLVTKRAVAHEQATMEWIDGNLGSKLTMKYPSIYLMGEGAHGEILSIAFAGQRPAPGRRRQGGPRRAQHDLDDHLQVDLQGRRPRQLPRPARDRARRTRSRSRRSSATRCCSTRSRARTPTRRSGSARTTSTSATRRPSPRSARSSSST